MGIISRFALLGALALGAIQVQAAPLEASNLISKRCVNSATDRSCWGDYDTSTDYYNEVPDTGVTVEVWDI